MGPWKSLVASASTALSASRKLSSAAADAAQNAVSAARIAAAWPSGGGGAHGGCSVGAGSTVAAGCSVGAGHVGTAGAGGTTGAPAVTRRAATGRLWLTTTGSVPTAWSNVSAIHAPRPASRRPWLTTTGPCAAALVLRAEPLVRVDRSASFSDPQPLGFRAELSLRRREAARRPGGAGDGREFFAAGRDEAVRGPVFSSAPRRLPPGEQGVELGRLDARQPSQMLAEILAGGGLRDQGHLQRRCGRRRRRLRSGAPCPVGARGVGAPAPAPARAGAAASPAASRTAAAALGDCRNLRHRGGDEAVVPAVRMPPGIGIGIPPPRPSSSRREIRRVARAAHAARAPSREHWSPGRSPQRRRLRGGLVVIHRWWFVRRRRVVVVVAVVVVAQYPRLVFFSHPRGALEGCRWRASRGSGLLNRR